VGQTLSLSHFTIICLTILVQTALISLASATLAGLFLLFSATCTGLIASAAFARCLATCDRKRSAHQETCDREPSQDLLDILEIHDPPPFS